MSQYKFTKSAKDVLTYLVLNGQGVQKELGSIVGCSDRTIIREVGKMRAAGYVDQDVGLERKRGKPRFILYPTFFGVLEIFMGFDLYSAETTAEMNARAQTLIEIAKKHKDMWVIFEEWEYIDAVEDLLDYTLKAIKEWMHRNTIPNKGIGRVSLRPDILPKCKHQIMAELLWGGDPIARTTDGLIFEPATLAYFKENQKLKEHMDEAIERQGELYRMRLAIIEAWAQGKLISDVLEEWSRE